MPKKKEMRCMSCGRKSSHLNLRYETLHCPYCDSINLWRIDVYLDIKKLIKASEKLEVENED